VVAWYLAPLLSLDQKVIVITVVVSGGALPVATLLLRAAAPSRRRGRLQRHAQQLAGTPRATLRGVSGAEPHGIYCGSTKFALNRSLNILFYGLLYKYP